MGYREQLSGLTFLRDTLHAASTHLDHVADALESLATNTPPMRREWSKREEGEGGDVEIIETYVSGLGQEMFFV